jgi:two-component system LytT family response regulator
MQSETQAFPHLLRRSIADLEQELDDSVFCSIHRSTIVNLDRIRGLKLNEEGEYEVLLDGGTELRMSRRYRKELQSRLGVGRAQEAF